MREVQLQHLQLPQLRELTVEDCPRLGRQDRPLRMGNLTSLHKLSVRHHSAPLHAGDQLPPNLQELHCFVDPLEDDDTREHSGLQPILALSRLELLELGVWQGPAITAEELQQLSRLSSLRELRLDHTGCTITDPADAAAAWRALPLKSLSWNTDEWPDALMHCCSSWGSCRASHGWSSK